MHIRLIQNLSEPFVKARLAVSSVLRLHALIRKGAEKMVFLWKCKEM